MAVDGVVYDVSNAKRWKKGGHQGHAAGADLTRELTKKSPHGTKVLAKVKAVGKLVKPEPAK